MLTRVRPKNKPPTARVSTIKPRPKPVVVDPNQDVEVTPATPKAKLKSIFWAPADWLKQGDFYRDAFAGALGTGIAALLVYLYAIGAGYIATPSKRQAMFGVILFALPAVIGAAASVLLHLLARSVPKKFERYFDPLPYLLFWIFVLAFLLVAANEVWPFPFWPFR